MRFRSALFALALLGASGQGQTAEIEGLRSYRAPDHTRVVFDLSGPVEHKVFTLENPDRIVVDLRSSAMQGGLDPLELDDTPILALRSAPREGGDLRVVLDLRAAVKPRSFVLGKNEQYGDRLVLDLYDSVPRAEPHVTASASEPLPERRDIVVAISAGHGGDDPGAIGVGRLVEKDVVLELSREIEAVLKRTPGYRPVMLREGDYYVDLRRRTQLAHQHGADLYIAIHADAFTHDKAQGATLYALSERGATSEQAERLAEKENAADLIGGVGSVSLADKDAVLASVLLDLSMTASIAASLEVGDRIIAALGKVTNLRRRNVEQAAFVELKSPDIPSLLIEAGYITNPHDAKNLNSAEWRRNFAAAVVSGITTWFYDRPPRGSLIAWQKNSGASEGAGRYRVATGDSLSLIAARHNLSLESLKSANGLSSDVIHVGQELLIPGNPSSTSGGAASAASSTLSFLEHTISRGETLSGIASSYAVPVERIRATNALNGDTILVGQTLRIPSS